MEEDALSRPSTNLSLNSSETKLTFNTEQNVRTAIAVLTIVFNGVCLILGMRSRKMSSIRNVFLQMLLLCISDIMVGISLLWVVMSSLIAYQLSSVSCDASFAFHFLSLVCSQMLICGLAVRRYIIIKNIRSRHVTWTKTHSNVLIGTCLGTVGAIVIALVLAIMKASKEDNIPNIPIIGCNLFLVFKSNSKVVFGGILIWLIIFLLIANAFCFLAIKKLRLEMNIILNETIDCKPLKVGVKTEVGADAEGSCLVINKNTCDDNEKHCDNINEKCTVGETCQPSTSTAIQLAEEGVSSLFIPSQTHMISNNNTFRTSRFSNFVNIIRNRLGLTLNSEIQFQDTEYQEYQDTTNSTALQKRYHPEQNRSKKQHRGTTGRLTLSKPARQMITAQRNAVKTLTMIVILVNVFSWPPGIMALVQIFGVRFSVQVLSVIGTSLAVNSLLNPFVYLFSFRHQLCKL